MGRLLVVGGALAVAGFAAIAYWRRHPRAGARTMNEVVNPILVRSGIAGGGRSELGTLEHVGRRSGTIRFTPIHPVLTDGSVRIVVPLGLQSEWARNVLAAGRCRMQLHDTVYELDRPVLLPAGAVTELPAASRWVGDLFGIMYLRLDRSGERPGTLGPAAEGSARAPGSAAAGSDGGAADEAVAATAGFTASA